MRLAHARAKASPNSAAEEKGARVVAVRGPGGGRRFLADRAPLLGASIARAQAQRRMDVGRAPITVASQHKTIARCAWWV
jgi:hypothetical protein